MLVRRALRGSGGWVVRGSAREESTIRSFCIKWCPTAEANELALTYRRLTWWRQRHPRLRDTVAEPVALWLDEKVLLLGQSRGARLSRFLERSSWRDAASLSELDDYGVKLGEWLHAFAAIDETFGAEIEPMLGLHVERRADGWLLVNARNLLERRIERGEQAADALVRVGASGASYWADRFDMDAIVSAFDHQESAGFIHGDFKPDNVLVNSGDFVVIDWWTTPRVSWPLTDVAALAADLRFCTDAKAASRFWSRFVESRYPHGMDERTRQAVDLIATITGLTIVAERIRRTPIRRLVAPRWYEHTVDRLGGATGVVGYAG